jgi:hypothetical protein
MTGPVRVGEVLPEVVAEAITRAAPAIAASGFARRRLWQISGKTPRAYHWSQWTMVSRGWRAAGRKSVPMV